MNNLDLSHYMTSHYVNGGREHPEYDCWGLVRHSYKALNGIELPRYDGLDAASGLGKSRYYMQLSKVMVECEPKHGAIAAVVRGRVCEHVGQCFLLSGEMWVLESTEPTGPRTVPFDQFVSDHYNVKCYAHA